jgi:DNA-binding NarL/FixJ family response regulator
MNKIKVMLVDDHQIMIDGLTSLLQDEKNMLIQGVAKSGADALLIMEKDQPDVLITDINMPFMSGIELTTTVKKKWPHINVLALSMFGDLEHVQEMIEAGISGYVLKNTGNKQLIEAINKIANGGTYYDDEITAEMLRNITLNNKKEKLIEKVSLTDREIQIVKLIAKEYSNAKIGEELFISERTVETHRKNIYRKTNTTTVVGLLKFAFTNGLIEEF